MRSFSYDVTGTIEGQRYGATMHVEADSHDNAVAALKADLTAKGWRMVRLRRIAA